jgi:hypothetical protein
MWNTAFTFISVLVIVFLCIWAVGDETFWNDEE